MKDPRTKPQPPQKPQPPVISQLWLREQFEQLDDANVLILKKIEDLRQLIVALGKPSGNVSPELEQAIRTSQILSRAIDAKVPDVKCG